MIPLFTKVMTQHSAEADRVDVGSSVIRAIEKSGIEVQKSDDKSE